MEWMVGYWICCGFMFHIGISFVWVRWGGFSSFWLLKIFTLFPVSVFVMPDFAAFHL